MATQTMDLVGKLLSGNASLSDILDVLVGKGRGGVVEIDKRYVVRRYDVKTGGKTLKFVDEDTVTDVFRELGMKKSEEFPFGDLRPGKNKFNVKSGKAVRA